MLVLFVDFGNILRNPSWESRKTLFNKESVGMMACSSPCVLCNFMRYPHTGRRFCPRERWLLVFSETVSLILQCVRNETSERWVYLFYEYNSLTADTLNRDVFFLGKSNTSRNPKQSTCDQATSEYRNEAKFKTYKSVSLKQLFFSLKVNLR